MEYPDRGIAILSSREGKVVSILCGDAGKTGSPLIGNCKYKTDKDIGMGSSKKDITSA